MSERPPACDERLAPLHPDSALRPDATLSPDAGLRADAALRALAELDSLEPSRSLDRAVLNRAREALAAANGRAHRTSAPPMLRWGLPASVAAAAICAVVLHWAASRSGAPGAASKRFVVLMQTAPVGALEMVRVSARYRGRARRGDASTAAAYVAPGGSGQSRGRLMPSFIETANELSIRVAPAPSRAATATRASTEWMPRNEANEARSPRHAFAPEREWTARRPMQPFELIDGVATSAPMQSAPMQSAPMQSAPMQSTAMRSAPPRVPAQETSGVALDRSSPGRSSASSSGAPASERESPPNR